MRRIIMVDSSTGDYLHDDEVVELDRIIARFSMKSRTARFINATPIRQLCIPPSFKEKLDFFELSRLGETLSLPIRFHGGELLSGKTKFAS